MAAPACSICELHAESVFKIEGMDCREEVAMLERRFKSLPGLEGFHADLIGQRLHVKYDAAKLSASTIASAVADAGMRPAPMSRICGTSCMTMMSTQRPIAVSMVAGRVRRTGFGPWARRSSGMADHSKIAS